MGERERRGKAQDRLPQQKEVGMDSRALYLVELLWHHEPVSSGFRRIIPSQSAKLPSEYARKAGALSLRDDKGEHLGYLMPDITTAVARAVVDHGMARSASRLMFYAQMDVDNSIVGPRREMGAFIFRENGPEAVADLVMMGCGLHSERKGPPLVRLFSEEGEMGRETAALLRLLDVKIEVVTTCPAAPLRFEVEFKGAVFARGGLKPNLLKELGGPDEATLELVVDTDVMMSLATPFIEKVGRNEIPQMTMVVYMDEGVKQEAHAIAWRLRRRYCPTYFMYQAKNIGRQLKEATDLDVDVLVIVGGEEWDRGEVEVRNFRTRAKQVVEKKDVERAVREILEKAFHDRLSADAEEVEEE